MKPGRSTIWNSTPAHNKACTPLALASLNWIPFACFAAASIQNGAGVTCDGPQCYFDSQRVYSCLFLSFLTSLMLEIHLQFVRSCRKLIFVDNCLLHSSFINWFKSENSHVFLKTDLTYCSSWTRSRLHISTNTCHTYSTHYCSFVEARVGSVIS